MAVTLVFCWRRRPPTAPGAGQEWSRDVHTLPGPASIGLGVTGAVLLAAVLHAVWNALAHAIADQLVGFALIGLGVSVGAVVIVLASPAPTRASWPFLVA